MLLGKTINYDDILKEINKLNQLMSRCRAKIESCRYGIYNSKLFKWVYNSDLEYYNSVYSRLLYRYKIINNLKNNFGKFITGIPVKDYKCTRKLIDLLDRLKFVEMMDKFQVQLEDISISFKDFKVHLK